MIKTDYMALYHQLCSEAKKRTHAGGVKSFDALKEVNRTEAKEDQTLPKKQIHHIWPKALGGAAHDPDNLCSLSPSEHVIAHLLFNIGMCQRGGACTNVVRAMNYTAQASNYADVDFFKDPRLKKLRFTISLEDGKQMSCTGRQAAMFAAAGLKLNFLEEKNLRIGFTQACQRAAFAQSVPGYSGDRKIRFDFESEST